MTTHSIESTASLLMKVQSGDSSAEQRLCEIYLPILSQWAHGRLPLYARSLRETDDLVQSTLIAALRNLKNFKPQREGAFLGYLRTAMINRIRNEISRSHKHQTTNKAEVSDLYSDDTCALEQAIGSETLKRYEESLLKLNEAEKEAIILRVEFGFSYIEIAAAIGANSANAARMKVTRALSRLAHLML